VIVASDIEAASVTAASGHGHGTTDIRFSCGVSLAGSKDVHGCDGPRSIGGPSSTFFAARPLQPKNAIITIHLTARQ
jgi:hypothetical protein